MEIFESKILQVPPKMRFQYKYILAMEHQNCLGGILKIHLLRLPETEHLYSYDVLSYVAQMFMTVFSSFQSDSCSLLTGGSSKNGTKAARFRFRSHCGLGEIQLFPPKLLPVFFIKFPMKTTTVSNSGRLFL
jgi:hypothetical protein